MAAPLQGLMQRHPLDVGMVLRRAATTHGLKQVISAESVGLHRQSWAETAARVGRLGNALAALGIRPGDRVGSLAWNTHRHLELYYAVPMSGAVLTTLNIRLHPSDVAWVARHAEISVIFVDAGLTKTLAEIRSDLPVLEQVVVMGGPTDEVDPDLGEHLSYEELLSTESPDIEWPILDENTAAVLCYTSGTTGRPKGVLYSHRSEVLHALWSTGGGLACHRRTGRGVDARPALPRQQLGPGVLDRPGRLDAGPSRTRPVAGCGGGSDRTARRHRGRGDPHRLDHRGPVAHRAPGARSRSAGTDHLRWCCGHRGPHRPLRGTRGPDLAGVGDDRNVPGGNDVDDPLHIRGLHR